MLVRMHRPCTRLQSDYVCMYRMSWSVDRPPCLQYEEEKIRVIFYFCPLVKVASDVGDLLDSRSVLFRSFDPTLGVLSTYSILCTQQQGVRASPVCTSSVRIHHKVQVMCVQQVKCRQKRAQIADDKDFEYSNNINSKSHNTPAVRTYGTREWIYVSYEYDVIGTRKSRAEYESRSSYPKCHTPPYRRTGTTCIEYDVLVYTSNCWSTRVYF